jgi:hypothetical protein
MIFMVLYNIQLRYTTEQMPYLITVVHLYQTVFDIDTNLYVLIKMQCSTTGSASEQRNH